MIRKIIYGLTISIMVSHTISAQIIDSVSLSAGYAEEVYYSTQSHSKTNVAKFDWDIAFQIELMHASILINSPNGVSLYKDPNISSSSFATLDTAGLTSWPMLFNSDTSWNNGAFNQNSNLSNPFDYGWGVYNQTAHVVYGDSIFVVKISSPPNADQYFKVWIEHKDITGYLFRYATLDNTLDTSISIALSSYTNKNFAYYSLRNNVALDREPLTTDWDILFTKYYTFIPGPGWYGVTGVLNNIGVQSAEANHVDLSTVSYTNYLASLNNNISEIGYDWKVYNQTQGVYDITDSLCYFIKSQNAAITRIKFLTFEGATTGNLSFELNNLTTAVNENQQSSFESFAVYPTVAQSHATVIINSKNNSPYTIELFDVAGKKAKSIKGNASAGLNNVNMDVNDLTNGMYIVKLNDGQSELSLKMIVRN